MLPLTNNLSQQSDSPGAVTPSKGANADRASGINFIRVLAAVLVVVAHCTSPYFHNPAAGIASFTWGWLTVVLSLLAVCVPLFFLLAGFVLLRPGIQPAPFYKRRTHKLLIPLVGWSVIYIAMRIFLDENRISFLSACRLIYNGEVYVHLWFLYVMLGVYLALPILSPLADRKQKPLLLWFVAFAILLSCFLPAIDHVLTLVSRFPFNGKIPGDFFPMSMCYLVIGALSRDFQLNEKRSRIALAGLILSLLFTASATCIESVFKGEPTSKWMGISQPGIVGAAICLFLLLKEVSITPRIARSLRHLSNWSFGLYISHPLIMRLFSLVGWNLPSDPAWGIPVYSALVLIGSIALVVALSKIPFIRRIV